MSTCCSQGSDVLNAVHLHGDAGAPMVVLEYGPYMWNHNPSRVGDILAELKNRGFSVTLHHVAEETTWEDHGFVRLLTVGGKLLVESKTYQHNTSREEPQQLLKNFPAPTDGVFA